jgi:hypothetical protein
MTIFHFIRRILALICRQITGILLKLVFKLKKLKRFSPFVVKDFISVKLNPNFVVVYDFSKWGVMSFVLNLCTSK